MWSRFLGNGHQCKNFIARRGQQPVPERARNQHPYPLPDLNVSKDMGLITNANTMSTVMSVCVCERSLLYKQYLNLLSPGVT